MYEGLVNAIVERVSNYAIDMSVDFIFSFFLLVLC